MKEMSKVPAHWEVLKDIVAIKNALKKDTLIIGNGDVMSLEEGKERAKETGADGVMFGRAIFGKPWLFADRKDEPTTQEKLKVLLEHVELFEEMWGDKKDFNIMKKHFKAYISGFDGASDLRAKLMETKNVSDIRKILKDRI
jgi:tRNA-dihydrouridine synthase